MYAIAYANKKTDNSINYANSMEKMGWKKDIHSQWPAHRRRDISARQTTEKWNIQYKIVGDGQKWEGFMTKIKEYAKFIKNLNPKHIVCVTDCYDVLACGSPLELLEKYRKISKMGKKIVFSGETHCSAGKCIYLSKYYSIENNIPLNGFAAVEVRNNKYLNSGFIMGTASQVLEALQYTLNLQISDDQLGMCLYAQQFPEKIVIDSDCELMGTICYNISDYEIGEDNRITNNKTLSTPCFIHTPCQNGDFSMRLDRYGRFLLGDLYKEAYVHEKIKRFIEHFGASKVCLSLIGGILISPKMAILYLILFCILLLKIK